MRNFFIAKTYLMEKMLTLMISVNELLICKRTVREHNKNLIRNNSSDKNAMLKNILFMSTTHVRKIRCLVTFQILVVILILSRDIFYQIVKNCLSI